VGVFRQYARQHLFRDHEGLFQTRDGIRNLPEKKIVMEEVVSEEDVSGSCQ
jgi:hypothetical protein